jgi:hypothetical protein
MESTARHGPPPGDRRTQAIRERQDAGVEANARLTAMTGALLLGLLAVEGLTIVRIGPFLKLHVFLGALLVPPIAVKLVSTIYRFGRFYGGAPAYRRKGPPPMLLRLLGPVLVILTVVVFATGIALLYVGVQHRGTLLFLHRASFILWFGVMVIHVVAHLFEVGRVARRDFRPSTRQPGYGGALRQLVILGAVAVGGVLGAALLGRVGHHFL